MNENIWGEPVNNPPEETESKASNEETAAKEVVCEEVQQEPAEAVRAEAEEKMRGSLEAFFLRAVLL